MKYLTNFNLKSLLLFCYSAIVTYFVIFKFLLLEVYKTAGYFELLFLGMVWGVYILLHLPILLLSRKIIIEDDTLIGLLKILPLPSIIGGFLLLLVTFTGRLIYQPLYTYKTTELKSKVTLLPISLKFQEPDLDEDRNRPMIRGMIHINNMLDFPIELTVRTKLEECRFQHDWEYNKTLSKGIQEISFICSTTYRNDINDYTLTFIIQEVSNNAVSVKRIIAPNDFSSPEGFKNTP